MKRAIFSLVTAVALGFAVAGCDDGGIIPPPPPPPGPTGSLTIVTSTVGGFPAAAFTEYACSIDGEDGTAIGPNDSHVHAVRAGGHMVEMTGVPANCRVEGENPRYVNVVEGEQVLVEFEITCG